MIKKVVNGCLCFFIFCLLKQIYVQIIDDVKGYIIVFVFMIEKDFKGNIKMGVDVVVVVVVGKLVVECVVVVGVKQVVFDCGGYQYYGCIKVFVDVVCDGGFEF